MAIKSKEEYNALVKVFYEKCDNGEISLDQREILINHAKNEYLTTVMENTKENVPDSEIMEEETKENTDSNDESSSSDVVTLENAKSEFERFKHVIYEKCNNGEISNDERESLIQRAKDDIFKKYIG